MDYRRFLARSETLVLPYLGGLWVHGPDRRLRVTQRVDPGWWTFTVSGRNATAEGPADPPSLSARPRLRGHIVDQWLFTAGDAFEPMMLCPDEEFPLLSPGSARRWHGGAVLYEGLEFEDEPEMAARQALEDGEALTGIKGVHPSLRAAFAFARVRAAGREFGRRVSPTEVRGAVTALADGSLTPQALLEQLQARRFRLREEAQYVPEPVHDWTGDATETNVEERASLALDGGGADLLAIRRMSDRNVEVTWRFLGERFISVVDWETLHVYDSGICLDGADEELGLDALPSVIREAMGTGELNITRF